MARSNARPIGKSLVVVCTIFGSLCPFWNNARESVCDAFSTPSFRWPSQNDLPLEDARSVIEMVVSGDLYSSSTASLFQDFGAIEISSSNPTLVVRAARMAKMAGDIYEPNLLQELYELGETIVANGTSADVAWVVTDSIDHSGTSEEPNQAILVRTITIRGYHAADDQVDRLRLLEKLCTASPVSIDAACDIEVHSGLWDITQDLYNDISPFLKGLSKNHKLVFNGHSIGGSLSVLLLMQTSLTLGAAFVRNNVQHVYTFGSPPVAAKRNSNQNANDESNCEILSHLNLPSTLVKGYVQPWDPIARIYSSIDPLYPLVDDIDLDGVTVWKSGPPRTLRPIVKKLLESWKDWPKTREKCATTLDQVYTHVGIQHILLPDSIRYMTDRLIAVNIAVPPTDTIIQIPRAKDLLPALEGAFPLDTFTISTVPVAVRSFVHHFYPAYCMSFLGFVNKATTKGQRSQQIKKKLIEDATMLPDEVIPDNIKQIVEEGANNMFKVEWAEIASDWVLGGRGNIKSRDKRSK